MYVTLSFCHLVLKRLRLNKNNDNDNCATSSGHQGSVQEDVDLPSQRVSDESSYVKTVTHGPYGSYTNLYMTH